MPENPIKKVESEVKDLYSTIKKAESKFQEVDNEFSLLSQDPAADPLRLEALKMRGAEIKADIEAFDQEQINLQQARVAMKQERQQELLSELAEKGPGSGWSKTVSRQTQYGTSSMPGYSPHAPTREVTTYKRMATQDVEVRKRLAELAETKENLVDTKGLPFDELLTLKQFSSPEDIAKVTSQWGYDDAMMVEIAGKKNFLLKRNKSYKLAFPLKPTLKGAASTALDMTPEIGAAAALWKNLPGKWIRKSIGSSAGSSGLDKVGMSPLHALYGTGTTAEGEGLVFDGIKQMAKNVTGQGDEVAIDTAIGFGIDALTSRGFPLFSRGVKRLTNPLVDAIEADAKLLKSKGYDIDSPISKTSDGMAGEAELAYSQRRSRLGYGVRKEQDQFRRFQEAVKGSGPMTDSQKKELFQGILNEYDDVAKQVGKGDAEIRKAARDFYERKFGSLNPGQQFDDELGGEMLGQIKAAKEQGKEIKNAAFDDFFAQADQAGVVFDRAAVINSIKANLDSPDNVLFESSGVKGVLDRLGAKESPTMNMKEVRNMIRAIDDSTGSATTNATTSQQVAQSVDFQLRKMMKDVADAHQAPAGGSLGELWEKTLKTYDETALAFNRSSPGAILREKAGDTIISPEDVVTKVLGNSKSTDDYLRALYNTGDTKGANEFRKKLQDAYSLRLLNRGNVNKAPKEADDAMINALWGRNVDGSSNPAAAENARRVFSELSEYHRLQKLNFNKLNPEDIPNLASVYSQQERKVLMDAMAKKQALADKSKSLLNNQLIKAAQEGRWEQIDNDMFVSAMWESTPGKIRQAIKGLTPKQKSILMRDFRVGFFERYSTGGQGTRQTGSGFDLWDGEQFMKDIKGWRRGGANPTPDLIKRMDSVLGESETDILVAASRLNAVKMPRQSVSPMQLKALVNPSGVGFYATHLFSGMKDKMLAFGYGIPTVRKALKRIGHMKDPIAAEKAFQNVMKAAVSTRVGIMHLREMSRNDPEFTQKLQGMLSEMANDDSYWREPSGEAQK